MERLLNEDQLSLASGSDLDEVGSLHSDDLDGDYGTVLGGGTTTTTSTSEKRPATGLRRQKTVNFGTHLSWDHHQNDVELECATFSNPGLVLDDEGGVEDLKAALEKEGKEEEETEEERLERIRLMLLECQVEPKHVNISYMF